MFEHLMAQKTSRLLASNGLAWNNLVNAIFSYFLGADNFFAGAGLRNSRPSTCHVGPPYGCPNYHTLPAWSHHFGIHDLVPAALLAPCPLHSCMSGGLPRHACLTCVPHAAGGRSPAFPLTSRLFCVLLPGFRGTAFTCCGET